MDTSHATHIQPSVFFVSVILFVTAGRLVELDASDKTARVQCGTLPATWFTLEMLTVPTLSVAATSSALTYPELKALGVGGRIQVQPHAMLLAIFANPQSQWATSLAPRCANDTTPRVRLAGMAGLIHVLDDSDNTVQVRCGEQPLAWMTPDMLARSTAKSPAPAAAAQDGDSISFPQLCSLGTGATVMVRPLAELQSICADPHSQWARIAPRLNNNTAPRLQCAGLAGTLTTLDESDSTVQVNFPDKPQAWFTPGD